MKMCEEAAVMFCPVLESPKSVASTDPVACICVKWAPLELLTREGEIDIAKRIEDGSTSSMLRCRIPGSHYLSAGTVRNDRVEQG